MDSRTNRGVQLLGGLEVGWLLWRTQLRMFINQTFRSKKAGRLAGTIIGAAAIVLAWSWEGFTTWIAVQTSQRVPIHADLVNMLSLPFFIYTAILVFSSLVFSLNALLLNPDLDLLLASPWPVASILGGRMVVQVLRLLLLSLLFTAPALLVLASALHNVLLPIAVAGLYLLYPVFVVVIISVTALLLVRFIPAGRGKEILTLFGVALGLGINLLNFLFNPAFRGSSLPRRGTLPSLPDIPAASSPWLPWGWAGRISAAILRADWLTAAEWGLVLLVVSVVLFVAGSLLSGRLYLAGWIHAVPPRRHQISVASNRRPRGAVPIIDPVVASILIKDWRMRTRDLAQLARFAMPLVFFVVLVGIRFPRLLSAAQTLGQGPVAAMVGLLPAVAVLFSLSIGLGLTAVSLEGKSIWIYAASPNTVLRLLQGKCWSVAVPTVAVVAIVAIVSEVLVHPGWPWAATAVLLAVGQAATVSTLMVGIGGVFARFDWTDVRRMMHPAAGFIGMGLFGLVIGASALLLVIALGVSSLTHFPTFTTWLGAVTVSVGGGTAVAALGVLIATERLRGLELG